jgi:hypothetical protein
VALQSEPLKRQLGGEAVVKLRKLTQKRLNKAQGSTISAVAQPAPTPTQSWTQRLTPLKAYTTLPDGLGNMPFIFCWQWPNQDYAIVSLVLNDIEGISDCFGHYQLSQDEFDRLLALFYRDLARVEIPLVAGIEHTLNMLRFNWEEGHPLPHEFTCWQGLLEAFAPPEGTTYWLPPCYKEVTRDVAVQLGEMTASLYQHPDFETWYLLQESSLRTQGDEDEAEADGSLYDYAYQELSLITLLPSLAQQRFYLDAFLLTFAQTVWQHHRLVLTKLAHRLHVASVLLHYQGSPTFSKLAYAESLWLIQVHRGNLPLTINAETLSQPRFTWHWLKTTLLELLADLIPNDDEDDDEPDDDETPKPDPTVVLALLNDTWARWRPQQKHSSPKGKSSKVASLTTQLPLALQPQPTTEQP